MVDGAEEDDEWETSSQNKSNLGKEVKGPDFGEKQHSAFHSQVGQTREVLLQCAPSNDA